MSIKRVSGLSEATVLARPVMIRDGLAYWPVPASATPTGVALAAWDKETRVFVKAVEEDPYEVAAVYMRMGFCPPLAAVERLYPVEQPKGLLHRWVVRGARRTARAVELKAREQVKKVHQIKLGLRPRGAAPEQLMLPLTFPGDKS